MPPMVISVDGGYGPVEISCFPGDDVEFGMTVVESAFRMRDRCDEGDVDIAGRLMKRLRRAYPAARIQRRHELASWGDSHPRLYAFRDGAAGASLTASAADESPTLRPEQPTDGAGGA